MDAPYDDRDSIAMEPINKHGIEKSRRLLLDGLIGHVCSSKKRRSQHIFIFEDRSMKEKRGEIFPFHPHRSSVYAQKMDRGGKPQSTS